MKKGKSASTNRGRNFNILLTVVALVLIVAVGGFATYSWVEQATTLDVEMNGDIQRVPGENTAYHQQVNLQKGENSVISLNDYVDKASDMMLSPVSSADGKNFFMQKDISDNTYIRSGSNSDRNVNYISFDFDVTSDTATHIYFDDGLALDGVTTSADHPEPSFKFGDGAELESIRVAIQVNEGTPLIFSRTSKTYKAISSTSGGETEVTTKAFEEYEFGGTPIFEIPKSTPENKINTKVRITIWIEGTDDSIGNEYQPGNTLSMKLMLTTPWSKAAVVKICDKTANSKFNKGSGKFYLVNGAKDTEMTQTTEKNIKYWTANITGSQDSLTFKYVEGETIYTWTASGRGDNFVYNIFDYGTTNGYGVWSPTTLQTETISIQDYIVDTSLKTGENVDLDSHIKVSTDGTKYYRAAYNTTDSKWTVNIDKNYKNLYVQYYSNGSDPTAKWDAKSTRTDKTKTTYYLLDTDGNNTDYSTGSWSETYNIYFYDGTAEQITTRENTTITYKAFSGETLKYTGRVVEDKSATYRFVADKQLKYTDKIDKVVFTLSRPTAKDNTKYVTYTWNGDGKVIKDIYYTANSYSYTED